MVWFGHEVPRYIKIHIGYNVLISGISLCPSSLVSEAHDVTTFTAFPVTAVPSVLSNSRLSA
jgi:hypothetical protein